MKNWQFITLLIVNIIWFWIVIAITQATNSLMPHINESVDNVNYLVWLQSTIPAKIDSIKWILADISNELNNIKKEL